MLFHMVQLELKVAVGPCEAAVLTRPGRVHPGYVALEGVA